MVLQKYSRNYSLYAYFAGTSAPHLEHVNKSSASGAWVTSSQSDLASIKSPSSSTSQVWVTCAVVMNVVLSSQKKQCVLITLVRRCFWYCAAGIHTPPQTHERVNNSLLAGCSAAPIQGQQQPKHGPRQLAEARICRMELSSQKHLLAKFLYSVPREKLSSRGI